MEEKEARVLTTKSYSSQVLRASICIQMCRISITDLWIGAERADMNGMRWEILTLDFREKWQRIHTRRRADSSFECIIKHVSISCHSDAEISAHGCLR